MSASIISAIVLCIMGLVKLPFKGFKEKYPKWYKAVFTTIGIVLSVVLSILDELYILSGDIISFEFLTLTCGVFAGVFFGYNGLYEGLGAKQLVKNIISKIKDLRSVATTEKAKKFLDKIEDIDEAINILTERKNNNNSEV